ncbi:uncharacterized protein P884DRAFT_306846 [Thermothelomyces heterothallicus CBS 202.75]|uniref:uncharacterized protein n=1 Tax=Thermothelomyces heterothallicus CBS 202.75 TaxID=1149848 RepID=UPI0037424B8E
MAFTDHDRTILGRLTTVFTPPAPCTYAVGWCSTCDVAWWGQTCAQSSVQDDTNCWPTTTDGAPEPSQAALYGWGFYSPGLECPEGHTTACTAIAGESSQWKVQFLMEAEETFAGCCPTGFHCDNLNGQTCRKVATSTAFPTVSCQDGASNNFGFITVPNAKVRSMNLYAPMIQIAWKSSDRPETSSSSTTTAGSGTTPTTSNPNPGISPSANTTGDSSSTLSTGAVAGIAVGAAALALLIFASAFFIFRRRRRHMNQTAGVTHPHRGRRAEHYYATAGTVVAELGQDHEHVEMFAENRRPAGGRGHGPVPAHGGVLPPPGYYHFPAGSGPNPVEMPTERN